MTQERPSEVKKDQDFVKSIFERGKHEPAAKKMSSLFGGTPSEASKAAAAGKRRGLKEISPVGVEIEAGSVAAVQLGKPDGQWEVIKSMSRNIQGARGSIRQFLSENEMKGDAVIGLSAGEVQFRILNLPPMPEAEIDGAVTWGVAEALGIEARRIADFNIDYDILSESGPSSRGKKVFVAAVRKDIVTERVKEASDAGLNVIAVEPSALALYSVFCVFSAPEASHLTLLLNIGVEASSLVIAAGRDVYAVQNVAFTGDILLRGALNDDGTVSSQQSASALENLIVDIEHSYKSVSNQFANPGMVALGKIAVCGPGAKHKGIGAFLKKTFNIPAEVFDPLNAGAAFAGAVGLAMRGRTEDEAV